MSVGSASPAPTSAPALRPAVAAAGGATFLDPSLEATFRRDGLVVVPFLSAEEVAELRAVYERHRPSSGQGFVTDFESAPLDVRSAIAAAVRPTWDRLLPTVLRDHRPFMTSFLMKWPGDDSDLYLHQDWTYVDERAGQCSVSFWVALDDASTALDNGPLHVVPGSHRLVDCLRGSNTPPWYEPFTAYFKEHSTAVDVRAGEAIVMDNRVVHWSPANRSGRPRLALAGAVVPREAQLIHPVDLGDGTVRVLAVDDAFFASTTPDELFAARADGSVLSVSPQQVDPLDPAAVEQLLGVPLPAEVADRLGGPAPHALGGSEPPEPGGARIDRLLTGVLRWNHRSVAAAVGPAGPLLDAADLPCMTDLERSWPAIRAEYDRVAARTELPTMDAVTAAVMPVVGRWSALVLRDNAGWIPALAERFPDTVAALEAVPGLRAALLSVMAPGARITPHRGANRGVVRIHLGIVVPGPPGACSLQVGDRLVAWAEGRAFAFDDTFEHAVTNHSREPRVSLMLELDRPLPGLARLRNELVQPLFRLHPQVRGSHRRLVALDRVLNG